MLTKAAAGKEKHNSLLQLPTSWQILGVRSSVFHSINDFPPELEICIKCVTRPFLTQKCRANPKNQVYGVYNCSKAILPKEIYGIGLKRTVL